MREEEPGEAEGGGASSVGQKREGVGPPPPLSLFFCVLCDRTVKKKVEKGGE